jgi:hypothetical protein
MAKSKGGGSSAASSKYRKKAKVRRPGVHSKKATSSLKTSKNYRKPYARQGK